jgi:DNA gyrase/topoisomerase IV subunit A
VVKKKKTTKAKAGSELPYLDRHMEDTADEFYYKYSLEVIEDRAIFGKIDGLKPVIRRALQAAFDFGLHHKARYAKAAKIVGDTMGNYHPHGDSSIYGAVVTAANSPLPMIDGSGNWGTMTDAEAAARYTNARLSLYSDLVFFDKFYLPIVAKVDNYDNSRKEPLILPALLPNALVNGNFGIAPGVRSSSPIVRFDTLMKAVLASIENGADASTCRGVELVTKYGGILHKTDDTKKEMKRFLETGRGRFLFDCRYNELSSHEIRIDGFPFDNISPTLLERVESIKGVAGIRDDSEENDRNIAFVVTFQKSLAGGDLKAAKNRVLVAFQAASTFNMQAVERELDENGKPRKKLTPTSIPDLINGWLDYRIIIEKRACNYWIEKNEVEIARLELMMLAVKYRDVIIKLLQDKKLDDEALAIKLAKAMKITVEQANYVLDLKIRQLKALEETKLKNKIKELKEEIAGYKIRIKKPRDYIHKHVSELTKKLSAEYTF